MPSRDTAAACDPSSLKCMPSHPPMPPFDVWRDRDWQGSHRARDSRAQPAPKPVEGCGIAMFAGMCTCRAMLPAYRQRSGAETCPVHVNKPLATGGHWHVTCITHNPKQADMWIATTFGMGTVHIPGRQLFL